MDEDGTLNELRGRIELLKEQRTEIMNELIGERREVELMQSELLKMKKEKEYLNGILKEKMTAAKEYDRIIGESERTLTKVPRLPPSSATTPRNYSSASTTNTASTSTSDTPPPHAHNRGNQGFIGPGLRGHRGSLCNCYWNSGMG